MKRLRPLNRTELEQLVLKLHRKDVANVKIIESALARKAARSSSADRPAKPAIPPKKPKSKRDVDFSAYDSKHVALRVMYFGSGYRGFASNHLKDLTEDSATPLSKERDPSVEGALFRAMLKARLIRSATTCDFQKCGRTDSGVSATGQVVTVTLRGKKLPANEMPDYPYVLNKLLPDDVLVVGHAECPVLEEDVESGKTYSARFRAESRTYVYFFDESTLDVDAMREGCRALEGTHDFQNFCKIDPMNVSRFVRTIHSVRVLRDPEPGRRFRCRLEIVGTAFLYHQVRLMVSVLFKIAEGNETVETLKKLLNRKEDDARPAFPMAPELPLVLSESSYPTLDWIPLSDPAAHWCVGKLKKRIDVYGMETRIAEHALDVVASLSPPNVAEHPELARSFLNRHDVVPSIQDQSRIWTPRLTGVPKYTPIAQLKNCFSYQELVDKLSDEQIEKTKKIHGWNLVRSSDAQSSKRLKTTKDDGRQE